MLETMLKIGDIVIVPWKNNHKREARYDQGIILAINNQDVFVKIQYITHISDGTSRIDEKIIKAKINEVAFSKGGA